MDKYIRYVRSNVNTNYCIRGLRVLDIKQGNNMKYLTFCVISMISLWASFGIHQNNAIDLTILHLNDIHARIEQTNKYLGFCKEKDVGK